MHCRSTFDSGSALTSQKSNQGADQAHSTEKEDSENKINLQKHELELLQQAHNKELEQLNNKMYRSFDFSKSSQMKIFFLSEELESLLKKKQGRETQSNQQDEEIGNLKNLVNQKDQQLQELQDQLQEHQRRSESELAHLKESLTAKEKDLMEEKSRFENEL